MRSPGEDGEEVYEEYGYRYEYEYEYGYRYEYEYRYEYGYYYVYCLSMDTYVATKVLGSM